MDANDNISSKKSERKKITIMTLKSKLLTLKRFEWLIWVSFFLVPLITGILAYELLPNESFDKTKHDLISSKEVEGSSGAYGELAFGEMALEWRDKKTGELFSRTQFKQHRREEAKRMSVIWFG